MYAVTRKYNKMRPIDEAARAVGASATPRRTPPVIPLARLTAKLDGGDRNTAA